MGCANGCIPFILCNFVATQLISANIVKSALDTTNYGKRRPQVGGSQQ